MSSQIIIDRIRDSGVQTMGRAYALRDGSKALEFATLEPSWVLNENNISCIPCGTYPVEKRTSQKFGEHFLVKEVPGRSYILLHAINFYNQTEGCIGVGERFSLLNQDMQVDIINSQNTLARLYKAMPEELQLTVKEHAQFQTMYNVQADSIASLKEAT